MADTELNPSLPDESLSLWTVAADLPFLILPIPLKSDFFSLLLNCSFIGASIGRWLPH